MKTVGRFLDCYHQICLHLSPTVLLFRFPHACLLERSSFVACCCTSSLASKFSLVSYSFCLPFLLSHFLFMCLLALFSFPNYFSFPVLLSKVFFFFSFSFLNHSVFQLQRYSFIISPRSFFLNERMFSVHLKCVWTCTKTLKLSLFSSASK